MFVKNLSLLLDYEKLGLTPPEKAPELTGYILKNYDEYCKNRKRPAVIVCPGGGYFFTSVREATPMAMEFVAAGMCAFVLRYSCAPSVYPTALAELAATVKMVREHAEEWNIDPEKIAVQGSSAGGHLAASLGVFWNKELLKKLGFSGTSHKPDALILSYPVISAVSHSNKPSFQNLFGCDEPSLEQLTSVSVEKYVSKDTPPSFLWHTADDELVPAQNSLLFAKALTECGVPMELHLYPEGAHGLSICNELVNTPENIHLKNRSWVPFAIDWLKKR